MATISLLRFAPSAVLIAAMGCASSFAPVSPDAITVYVTTSEVALPPEGLLPVTPGYVPTMGMTVTAGRDFVHDDAMERQPVMVNETLARALYPNEDPVGSAAPMPAPCTRRGFVPAMRASRIQPAPCGHPDRAQDVRRDDAIQDPGMGFVRARLAPTARR